MTSREIARRFGKSSLLAIAEELELGLPESTTATNLVSAIKNDLKTNGIVEGDVSDDLFDIMVAFGFMDVDGNILEEADSETSEGGDSKEEEQKRPECFGWGDLRDPACKRCKMGADCQAQLHAATIPAQPCWGEYDSDDPECVACIPWRMCKDAKSAA